MSVEELWKALILLTAGLIDRCVTALVQWCAKRCVQSNAKGLFVLCCLVCEVLCVRA